MSRRVMIWFTASSRNAFWFSAWLRAPTKRWFVSCSVLRLTVNTNPTSRGAFGAAWSTNPRRAGLAVFAPVLKMPLYRTRVNDTGVASVAVVRPVWAVSAVVSAVAVPAGTWYWSAIVYVVVVLASMSPRVSHFGNPWARKFTDAPYATRSAVVSKR